MCPASLPKRRSDRRLGARYQEIGAPVASLTTAENPSGRAVVIILLAWIVHLAGGGLLDFRLGHFVLSVGFT